MDKIESYIRKTRAKKSKHTEGNYKSAIGLHLRQFLDDSGLNLDDLNDDNIFLLYDYFEDSNLAGSTINEYLGCIARFLEDEVSVDVADEVREFSFNAKSVTEEGLNTQTPILSVEQYIKLCESTTSTRDELIVRLLWGLGVRPQEMVEIKLDNVDREAEIVTVETAKIPPQSTRPRNREIPYSPELNSVLREWIEYGGRNQFSTSNSDYLLITERSEKMSPNYPNQVIRKVAEEAGLLEEYSGEESKRQQYYPNPRHFRNSYATHRIRNGMDLETLRDLMGHHDVSVTAKYVQTDTETKREKNEQYRPKSYDSTHEVTRNI